MLLKPLATDDIEVNMLDELGFFGPYYRDVEPSSTISDGIYDDITNSPISMRRLEAYVNKYDDHPLVSVKVLNNTIVLEARLSKEFWFAKKFEMLAYDF
ncbi:hypothetical protein Tco_0863750 [Tanacetum coccineum]